MKTRFFTGIAATGLTLLIITGCSKLPQAEIDAASLAIEEARSAGADVYIPEIYADLQDSLNRVMVNLETQKSKFIRNYSSSREDLAAVGQYAAEVKQQAETRKEALKVEIQQTISEVKTLIATNRQLILEAPRGKEGTSALMTLKGEIDAVETSILETSALFESGDYLATMSKALAAKEKATAINTELSRVITKYKENTRVKKA